eukprot:CAMPEP_0182611276 /NCGR_PEP_ID=MMETSP1330-20130603/13299_1 /TAXON_ID=464278 /ORGANISM="Picochlorum sp., Strain RCC944" /LENGTH=662 /DNA_ID=CAMNT_0024830657 /DNA_START=103 /DNA_END=2091 /DNA_ORIENTATION=-
MTSLEESVSAAQWPPQVLSKRVSIAAGLLQKIEHQLLTKKKMMRDELKVVGFQPKSTTHAIFNQCRVFDGVFRKKLNETVTTGMIRDAFLGGHGLRENIQNLKLDTFFNETYVKQICRQADGYQPHLVSPEKGLKLLVKEAMSYVVLPAERCVDDVKLTLITTIQNAARDLSKHTFGEETKSLRPTSQQMLMEICEKAIDVWSDQAKEMAMKLVNMEGDYITSQFFRRLAESRAIEMEKGEHSDDSDAETPLQQPDEEDSLKGIKGLEGNARDYMMGYLEKNSETHTGAFKLPVESWKWQKRWFVLSEAKGKLYYFKDPDELPQYRGVIDMSSCIIEDLGADTKRSKQLIQSKNGESFSLLISLSSIELGKPILKDHVRVILRAEDAASKYEWLARLRQSVARVKSSTPSRRSSIVTPEKGVTRNKSVAEISPIKSVWGDMLNEEPRSAKRGSPFSAYFKQTLRGKKGKDSEFYATLGNDLSLYTQMVLESLCRTIPKAVVHCQVKRAETEMLEELYAEVNELSSQQLESMTFEGSEVTQRRAALIHAKGDVLQAIKLTRGLISSVSGLLDETETIEIPSKVLEVAGMSSDPSEDTPSAYTHTHIPRKANDFTRTSAVQAPAAPAPVAQAASAAIDASGPSPVPPTRMKPKRRRPPPPPPRK